MSWILGSARCLRLACYISRIQPPKAEALESQSLRNLDKFFDKNGGESLTTGELRHSEEKFAREMKRATMTAQVLADGCAILLKSAAVRVVVGSVVSGGNLLNAGSAAVEWADGKREGRWR